MLSRNNQNHYILFIYTVFIFKTVEKNNGQYIDSKIFWASGACMFLQKKQFFELGGFDERFFAHMEEIDLCWRAFNSGIDCLASSNSIVYHIGAATIKEDSNKNYLNYRNSLIMLTKNLPLKSLLYVIFILVMFREMYTIHFTEQPSLYSCTRNTQHIHVLELLTLPCKHSFAFHLQNPVYMGSAPYPSLLLMFLLVLLTFIQLFATFYPCGF